MNWLQKLFAARTYSTSCDTCQVYRERVLDLDTQIATLKEILTDERKLNRELLLRMRVVQSEATAGPSKEHQPVRQSRTPWSRKQADLESESRLAYWKKQAENAGKIP